MINIVSSSNLGIILQNTNKALDKVLTEATHKELESITQGKDLKTVMGNILKQSKQNPDANKELLNLVKNNPTLKNLGDVSTTIKDLLSSLKSDNNPLPIEKVLKTFLSDIKDLKNSELKQKIENSGVFLESKLKDVKNPQVELKNTLITLAKTLQNSNSPQSRAIANETKLLLNIPELKSAAPSDLLKDIKTNPKALEQLSKNVEALVSKLKTFISKADVVHRPVLDKALIKLEHQLEPKMLTSENFKLSSLKESLEQVNLQMGKSFTSESKGILGALDKIFSALKTIEQSTAIPKVQIEQLIEKNIPKQILRVSDNIKNILQKADPILSKDTGLILNKLETLNTPTKLDVQNNTKELIAIDLKAVLLKAGDEISKTPHANQSEILKNIDKLSLQIDNYQLLSHLSNGTSMYLPFSWDMMEEGNIQMKKSDDEKFYCDINLKLKEYGELNLKLTLYEKNQLNLHIYSSNKKFKEIIKENIPSLRSALIDTQITPREIRLLEPRNTTHNSPYQMQDDGIHMGFEVKG